jgi:hypothetical protein
MTRPLMRVAALFVAFLLGGCFLGDRAADRTLTIYQFQSTRTYTGQFRVDASQLPRGAVKTEIVNRREGTPVTRLKIDQDCPIQIVLVPLPEAGIPPKPSWGGSNRAGQ